MSRILMVGLALVLLAGCSTTTIDRNGEDLTATTKVTAGFYDLDKEVVKTMNAVHAACNDARVERAFATTRGAKIVAQLGALESVIAASIKVLEQWKSLVDTLHHHTFAVTAKCSS